MAKVTGIGGVFFKTEDPEALTRWYAEHLGLVTHGPQWGLATQRGNLGLHAAMRRV